MKIALLSEEPQNLQRVFPEELRERLAALGELYGPVLSKATLEKHKRFTCDCEAIFPPGGWRRSLRRRYKPIFRICGPCSMPREQSSISLGRFWSAGWRCSAHGRRMPFRWQNSPLRKLCLRQRAISNQQAGAKRAIGARSTWRRGILAITDCRLVSSGLAASGRSCANG